MVCRQETAKTLNFEDISLIHRYNLRRSLAFQTTSKAGQGGRAQAFVNTKSCLS